MRYPYLSDITWIIERIINLYRLSSVDKQIVAMRIKLRMSFGHCSISDGLFHGKALIFL
jgi:hypothetical protein